MRFPRLLFAQAIVNIPFSLIYGLIGIIIFVSLCANDASNYQFMNIYWMIGVWGLIMSFIAGITSTVMLFRKSKYSYAVFFVYMIATAVPNVAYFIYVVLNSNEKFIDMAVLSIFSIYLVWLLIVALRPYHVRWALSQGRKSETLLNPRFLVPCAFLMAVPLIGSVIINTIGIRTTISRIESCLEYSSSSSESRDSEYNIYNVCDGSNQTVWIPRYGKGVNQWIRIDVTGDSLPVSGINILPDVSGKCGRAKEVQIETSDGTKFMYCLKDTAEEQTIPLKEKNHKWIMLTFKSIYPERENPLGIAELSLYSLNHDIIRLKLWD